MRVEHVAVLVIILVLAGPGHAAAQAASQQAPPQQQAAPQPPPPSQAEQMERFMGALKASLAGTRRYQWVKTTVVSVKGNEKNRKQALCSYAADGTVRETPLTAPEPPPDSGSSRGLRGRVQTRVAEKKEEMVEYMQAVGALVKQYVPPDPARIQACKEAGRSTTTPPAQGSSLGTFAFQQYLKPADSLTVRMDMVKAKMDHLAVGTYLSSPSEPVTLDVTFAVLPDGTGYPSRIVLDESAKSIQVVIQNTDYKPLAATK